MDDKIGTNSPEETLNNSDGASVENAAAEEKGADSSETFESIPELSPDAPEYIWTFSDQLKKETVAEKKNKAKAGLIYSLIVTVLFLISFGILIFLLVNSNLRASKPEVIEKTIYVREYDKESGVLTLQEIAAKVTPSTVGISVSGQSGNAVGSGFIIDKNGHVATNYHVINGARSVKVVLSDGRKVDATIVGGDEISDVAVVKIDPAGLDLVPVEIGDSDSLVPGDQVVAIGNPAGLEYSGTVTEGIVSAINRNLKFYSDNGLLEKTMTVIQMTATINPGNSGGPLIDVYGKVVGINSMKLASSQYVGIYFAIPSKGAMEIITEVIATGSYSGNSPVAQKGVSLGITGTAVTKGLQIEVAQGKFYDPPADGVLVISISGKDASAYGVLRQYDLITVVDGKPIKEVEQIREILLGHKQGDVLNITIIRDGKTEDVSLRLK